MRISKTGKGNNNLYFNHSILLYLYIFKKSEVKSKAVTFLSFMGCMLCIQLFYRVLLTLAYFKAIKQSLKAAKPQSSLLHHSASTITGLYL